MIAFDSSGHTIHSQSLLVVASVDNGLIVPGARIASYA